MSPEELERLSQQIAGYMSEECPYCHQAVYGVPDDIDSGMRKHIEYCESAPTEDDDI